MLSSESQHLARKEQGSGEQPAWRGASEPPLLRVRAGAHHWTLHLQVLACKMGTELPAQPIVRMTQVELVGVRWQGHI